MVPPSTAHSIGSSLYRHLLSPTQGDGNSQAPVGGKREGFWWCAILQDTKVLLLVADVVEPDSTTKTQNVDEARLSVRKRRGSRAVTFDETSQMWKILEVGCVYRVCVDEFSLRRQR